MRNISHGENKKESGRIRLTQEEPPLTREERGERLHGHQQLSMPPS